MLVISGETGYLFFYNSHETKNQASQISLITPTTKTESQNQTKGEADLINLISKVKSGRNTPINGIAYLKRDNASLKKPFLWCSLMSNCVEIDNMKKSNWLPYNSSSTHIRINYPFLIKLRIKNKNNVSGIALFERVDSPTSQSWKILSKFFFGLNANGNQITVDAQDGATGVFFNLVEKEVKNITTFNIFFDKNGKHILVTDDKYQHLAYLDVNQITKNQFPNGLFPYGKIYLNAVASPYSYLFLSELSIIPISN